MGLKNYVVGFMVSFMICYPSLLHQAEKDDLKKYENVQLEKNVYLENELLRLEERINKLNSEVTDLTDTIDDLQKEQTDTLEMMAEEEEKAIEMMVELERLERGTLDPEEYYAGTVAIYEKYAEYFGMPTTIYDVYTEEEIRYLCQMVETETHGADLESKMDVANVVFNRIEDPRFPNDVISVITAPNQFAYFNTNITETSERAVEYAFMFPDTTNGALAFHSGPKSDTFWGYEYIFTDSVSHHFYK